MAYDIGLDMGTNSLGWAVVDENGKLCTFKHKPMRGSIIDFSSSSDKNPNEMRRRFRGQRRRLQRRRQRIFWLQNLMAEMVAEVDSDFFAKLRYSYMSPDDEGFDFDNILHIDRGAYQSVNYRNEYPTIYHLRKALMTGEKMDIRLIYLALHHIVTNRGNFLYEGQTLSLKDFSINEDIAALFDVLDFNTELLDVDYIVEVLSDSIRKGEKKDKLIEYLTPLYETEDEELQTKAIVKSYVTATSNLMIGYSADFGKIIRSEDKINMNLSSELSDDVLALIDDESLDIVSAFEKVYSGFVILNLVNGEDVDSVSDCYINRFIAHGLDLVTLKRAVRKYIPSDYKTIINNLVVDKNDKAEFESYALYMKRPSKHKLEKLYDTIKKKLLENKDVLLEEDDEDIRFIRERIEDGSFLLRPRNSDNSAIPYQFNVEEMVRILDNQGKYYPELLSIKEKLVKLVEFRIPYFVGPLQKKSPFAWVVRTDEKIDPWNFEQVVDFDASEQNFIRRMTCKCSELVNEDVLPRCSPIYQSFDVLNELANIRIDGRRLSPDVKAKAHNELFMKNKKVSKKTFQKWLEANSLIPSGKVQISGFADEEKSFMASRSFEISLRNIVGDKWNLDMAENLSEILTVFSSPERVVSYILRTYPDITEEQAVSISKIKCKGWGRFSRKLLTGVYARDINGNPVSVMDLMLSTDQNYMEIKFNPEYGFVNLIEKENCEFLDGMEIEDFINDYPVSSGVRHMTYVTYKAVMEIIEAMGGERPRSIYIETADGEEPKKKKKASKTRYKKIKKLYEDLTKDPEYREVYKELMKLSDYDQKNLKTKMMLYFLQNGKSLYSGKPLGGLENIANLEIDHIVPQCYIKDNSIDNLALVFSKENQRKADSMLLSDDIIGHMCSWWKQLYDAKFISRKKFDNLIRTSVTEKDMEGFINRQLVETRQETKLLMYVLKMMGLSEVYGVSAKLTSSVRSKYSKTYTSMIKIREVNDYHHADDAYLAARVGYFVQKQFSPHKNSFVMDFYRELKDSKDLRTSRYGLMSYLFGINSPHWKGKEKVAELADNFNGRSYFIKYNTDEKTGEFFNQTKQPKGSGTIPLSSKMNSIDVYGGYTNDNDAYFVIAKNRKGKKSLKGIPIRIAALHSDDAIDDYLRESKLELVRHRKICKYQEITYKEKNGRISNYLIVGDKEVINARQLYLNNHILYRLYNLESKYMNYTEKSLNAYEVFEALLEHMSTYACYEDIYNTLIGEKDKFNDMSIGDKVELIKNMLVAMHANSARVEPSGWKIAKAKSSRIPKTLDIDSVRFIDKSITGMYKNIPSYCKKG